MNFWLLKSDANSYSVDDLAACPRKTDHWDGVRNYQARNFMREMNKGDRAFFYHSQYDPPGIAGIVEVVRAAYPDHTAFDPGSKYFDPRSSMDAPRWFMVDVRLLRKLKRIIPLRELKAHAAALDGLEVLKRGSRLSVMPVERAHWNYILGLEER